MTGDATPGDGIEESDAPDPSQVWACGGFVDPDLDPQEGRRGD